MSAPTLYSPTIPATSGYSNLDLNALASTYGAAPYSHNTTALIARIVRSLIYDSAPQQYLDLMLLNMNKMEQVDSDEIHYHEMGYGRDPLVSASLSAGVSSGATQVIEMTAASFAAISLDSIIVYPTNEKATVTTKTPGSPDTITVTAQTGETLPALTISTTYTFSYHSPVEADGADYIKTYYRVSTTERTNFVQMLVKALRMGKMELYKYQRAGTTQNYIAMQQSKMLQQFRTSISNIYWNGKMGEVTLADGSKAKTAGGIYPIMVAAGSPSYESSLANLPVQVEEALLDTEYNVWGYTRFLYASPRVIHYLSQRYKRDLTRYTPNDSVAKLDLNMIDIGSSKLVFVPVKRFEEQSCFPASFASRIFILDQNSIFPVRIFPEEMGFTLDRRANGTLQNYVDSWVSATFSVIYNNPLGGAIIDVTDLNG